MQHQEFIFQHLDQQDIKSAMVSKLGFFSKPIIMRIDKATSKVVKIYHPIQEKTFIEKLILHHNNYITVLSDLQIKVPPTEIAYRKKKNKYQLIITQDPFQQDELVRGIMETADWNTFQSIMLKMLNEVVKFYVQKGTKIIGFHPTLRNYAIRNGELWYFDTFPPMLTDQPTLNRLILKMTPVHDFLKNFVPISALNRVSNEYYDYDKMFLGIVGSCCRLRQEFVPDILNEVKLFIENNNQIPQHNKISILEALNKPPRLPWIWTTIRRLLGKEGKPNVA